MKKAPNAMQPSLALRPGIHHRSTKCLGALPATRDRKTVVPNRGQPVAMAGAGRRGTTSGRFRCRQPRPVRGTSATRFNCARGHPTPPQRRRRLRLSPNWPQLQNWTRHWEQGPTCGFTVIICSRIRQRQPRPSRDDSASQHICTTGCPMRHARRSSSKIVDRIPSDSEDTFQRFRAHQPQHEAASAGRYNCLEGRPPQRAGETLSANGCTAWRRTAAQRTAEGSRCRVGRFAK